MGQVVSNEDDAYNLYNNYANFEVGFGIRVNKTRYAGKTDQIRQKEYVCSCAGFKQDRKPGEEVQYSRLDGRTGCGALFRFGVKVDGG